MKKTYAKPSLEVVSLTAENIIALSGLKTLSVQSDFSTILYY